ncbi:fungal-specific transcription factor domain-containing protein [Trichoderma evansii]
MDSIRAPDANVVAMSADTALREFCPLASISHYQHNSEVLAGVLMPAALSPNITLLPSSDLSQLLLASTHQTASLRTPYDTFSPPSTASEVNTSLPPLDPAVGYFPSLLTDNLAMEPKNNIEFYGFPSIMQLLCLVQAQIHEESPGADAEEALISFLYSAADGGPRSRSPLTQPSESTNKNILQGCCPDGACSFDGAKQILIEYFDGIHYTQPFLNQGSFMARCQLMWNHGPSSVSTAFRALYLGVLSLSVLVRPPRRDGYVDAHNTHNRYKCSRRLFQGAHNLIVNLSQSTELETVQCFFFLAKICQQEQDLHTAYLFAGQAVRAALAMGLNRRPVYRAQMADAGTYREHIRTWWTLYALDVELSVFLGRPDSLGDERYHTCPMPRAIPIDRQENSEMPSDAPEVGIIGDLTRLYSIARREAPNLSRHTWEGDNGSFSEKAKQLDRALDTWLDSIPRQFRPGMQDRHMDLIELAKQAHYTSKQKLFLGMAYYSVRMILLTPYGSIHSSEGSEMQSYQADGTGSSFSEPALQMIHFIYHSCCQHEFLRYWWCNAIYTTMAACLLLATSACRRKIQCKAGWHKGIQKALDILKVMEGNVVLQKTTRLLQEHYDKAKTTLGLEAITGFHQGDSPEEFAHSQAGEMQQLPSLNMSQWQFINDIL